VKGGAPCSTGGGEFRSLLGGRIRFGRGGSHVRGPKLGKKTRKVYEMGNPLGGETNPGVTNIRIVLVRQGKKGPLEKERGEEKLAKFVLLWGHMIRGHQSFRRKKSRRHSTRKKVLIGGGGKQNVLAKQGGETSRKRRRGREIGGGEGGGIVAHERWKNHRGPGNKRGKEEKASRF